MTAAELVERITSDLGTADANQGRRLVLVEWEPAAWRVGYSVPRYADAWEPGAVPWRWVVLDWLTAAERPSEPVCWPSLGQAAVDALAIRRAALDGAPFQCAGAEILVVVAEQPRAVVV